MIQRTAEEKILELTTYFPCVGIIGPRQVGKTTLVKEIIKKSANDYIYLDLEKQKDLVKLEDPESFFQQFENQSFIIDEIQRKKEIFPVLRSVIDENRKPGRFILLGSASPDLIRDSSESLAGRIAYHELYPFTILEINKKYSIDQLWFRGGFPDAFSEKIPWILWIENYIRSYVERDLEQLGFPGNSTNARRLWQMLAHNHANIINYSELGKSLELDLKTVKSYIYFLESAFLVRVVPPYFNNMRKRLVKSPKVYIRDSGILHFFLGLSNMEEIFGHPKMGASWEGFVIEQIHANLPKNRHCYFYRTHDGAELDLVIERGGVPIAGIEIKFGSNFSPSRGNTEAILTLGTSKNFIIVKEKEDFIHKDFRVCGIEIFLEKYLPEI